MQLSPELAAIVLDPNGDPQTKASIKEAVLSQILSSNSNEPQESECDPALNIPTNTHSSSSSSKQCVPDKIHIWNENEERLLLQLRFDDEKNFKSQKNHDVLWGKIADKLNTEGVNVTKVQAMNKWKTLKKKYKEVVDENNKTGNQKTTWKYYEIFNKEFGNKAGTKASITYDSLRDYKLKVEKKDSEGSSNKNEDESSNTSEKGKSTKHAKKRKTEINEVLLDQAQAQNDKLLGTLRKQHKDKMRRMDRFLNIFEKSVRKESK